MAGDLFQRTTSKEFVECNADGVTTHANGRRIILSVFLKNSFAREVNAYESATYGRLEQD